MLSLTIFDAVRNIAAQTARAASATAGGSFGEIQALVARAPAEKMVPRGDRA